MASPDELLCDSNVSGLFIYEEDPFHYLNGEMVKNALGKKEFIAVCDLLPTAVMDFAHLVLPSDSFAEKEGTFISGDGSVRAVKKAWGTAAGYEFLNELLGRLGGKRYNNPAEIKSELRRMGILREEYGDRFQICPLSPAIRFAASGDMMPHRVPSHDAASCPPPNASAHGETRKYRLILRDLFMNHHLCDLDLYGKGIARVQKDLLFISPEDAALLNIAAGESVCMESSDGAVTRPVTIKAGMKTGVLECVLFQKRSEMLALSLRPSKVVAVSVRKV
jgi:anaerobic selenocysteine-containing dehydrogenase